MIEILKYTPINKDVLKGKFSIKIHKWGGFYLRDMTYFQKGNNRWIGYPCKPFEVEGEKKYMLYAGFEDKHIATSFQNKVLAALDDFFKKSN